MTAEERDALRLWFEAFEPAVDVELHPSDVVIRSSRPRRTHCAVRVRRTGDLVLDLNTGLAQLVTLMGG